MYIDCFQGIKIIFLEENIFFFLKTRKILNKNHFFPICHFHDDFILWGLNFFSSVLFEIFIITKGHIYSGMKS